MEVLIALFYSFLLKCIKNNICMTSIEIRFLSCFFVFVFVSFQIVRSKGAPCETAIVEHLKEIFESKKLTKADAEMLVCGLKLTLENQK